MSDTPGDADDLLGEAPPRRRWPWQRQWRWPWRRRRSPDGLSPDAPPAPRRRRRLLKIGLIAIVVLLLIYYPVGMLWVNKIDDDPDFDTGPVAARGQQRRRHGRRA